MSRKKVLCVLSYYPQLSQSYMESELRALEPKHDIKVVSIYPVKLSYPDHLPFTAVNSLEEFKKIVEDFSPDVLHGHYMHVSPLLSYASRLVDAPFTVRTHSFDVLGTNIAKARKYAKVINDRACLGVLAFPFAREGLRLAGIKDEKIHDCYPVVNFDRFHDRSPNGDAVMNTGACIPKKNMEDFLRLGSKMTNKHFDLYALDSGTDKRPSRHVEDIREKNQALGSHVQIIGPFQHADMPAEYKKHEWLVYTACPRLATVGWPMAVAEAQAAGVGVCMQNIRPDLREYLGDAGFLFDDIDEAAKIISQPFPEDMRSRGFEHARKSDVGEHISILEGLWDQQPSAGWWKPRPSFHKLQRKSERFWENRA